MTSEPIVEEEILEQLEQRVRRLVDGLTGPLRRITVRSGEAVVEIEWHGESIRPPVAVPRQNPAVPPAVAPAAASDGPDREVLVSPIVGTFYRSVEPGAPPYVEVGDLVETGQVIGIVEAMKLMNHITAEHAGRVAEVLVGDGEPVEFQQPLIALVSA